GRRPTSRRARNARPGGRPWARRGWAGRRWAGGPSRLASPRGLVEPHARQQIVDGKVLVLAPHLRAAADGLLAQRAPAPRVVALEGLAHGQVAGGTDVAAPAAAREEPVGRP